MNKAVTRIHNNAEYLMEQYASAAQLLQTAMQEAMPWAVSYATQKRVPRIDQVERLCTQLLAIVIASAPDNKPDNSDFSSRVLPFSQ